MSNDNPTDVLARVAQNRQKRIKQVKFDYPIPTWGGDVLARFRVTDREDVVAFSEAPRSTASDVDFIIRAIEVICVRNPDTKKVEPLLTEAGTYVQFDEYLAEKLGVADEVMAMTTPEFGPSRAMVMFMFNGNEVAIGSCVAQLLEWMQDTDRKVTSSLVGES